MNIPRLPQLTNPDKVSIVLGTAGLGLSIFDAFKARGIDTSKFKELIEETSVDTKKYVDNVDPTVNVVNSPKTLANFVDKELGDRSIIVRSEAKRMLGKAIEKGNNAFAFPGNDEDYIIASKDMNPVVIDHEIGHVKDFRQMREEGTLDKMKKQDQSIIRGLGRMFSKRIHEKDIISREERAWANVTGEDKKELEQTALDTYKKGFHYGRGKLVGTLGGSMIGSTLGLQVGRRYGSGRMGSLAGSIIGALVGGIPTSLSKPTTA